MLQWVIFVKCYVCAIIHYTLLSFYHKKLEKTQSSSWYSYIFANYTNKYTIWPLHDEHKKLANFITQVWKTRSLLWLYFLMRYKTLHTSENEIYAYWHKIKENWQHDKTQKKWSYDFLLCTIIKLNKIKSPRNDVRLFLEQVSIQTNEFKVEESV